MPKYSVEDVLEIIKGFTAEEKTTLQAQLPLVLGVASIPNSPARVQTQQSQAFGDIAMGSSSSFGVNQISSQGDATLAQDTTQVKAKNADIAEVRKLLQGLKQQVEATDKLDIIEKGSVQSTIGVVEKELDKPKPDKDLVDKAIATLDKGLKGVQTLAEPTMKVAALIAKAWAGIL